MSTLTAEHPGEAASTPPKVSPGKGWYWVFVGVIVASVVAAGAIWLFGNRSVENQVGAFARFVAPNSADLRFKRAGQYLVYYEYRSSVDGQQIDASSSPPPGIALDLKDEAGQSLELRRIGREYRYDVGDYQGVSLRRVTIPRQGLYRMTAAAPGGEAFVVALGRGDTPSTDSSQQTALLVGIIGSALGVVGLVTVGVLRSRSRAGLRRSPGAGAAAPPPEPPAASESPALSAAAPGPAPAGTSVPPPPVAAAPPAALPPLPDREAAGPSAGSSSPPPPPPPPTPARGLPVVDRPRGGGWNPPVGEAAEPPGGEERPKSPLPPPPPPPA